jgi:elongation factor 1-gamma
MAETYTLRVDAGNFRAFKILVAAELNGVSIDVPSFVPGTDDQTDDFKSQSPMGRVPVLTTAAGTLFESNAIARFVGGMNPANNLNGAGFFEEAQVSQWMDFCTKEIDFPACVWMYPTFGYTPANEAATAKAKKDLSAALKVVEGALKGKDFLVGSAMTLADITIVSSLVYPFKFVCDGAFRKQFPAVSAWFDKCVTSKAFADVVGKVTLCVDELEVGAAQVAAPKAKQEKKAKAPKAEAKKKEPKAVAEEDEAPPPPKRPDHPFKIMDKENKSPFVMDAWKVKYSNEKGDYTDSMNYFWDNYDAEGWSIWRGEYKWNEEHEKLFMTSNLIGGFIQRTEEIRKWFFGTMTIRGEEGKGMKVSGHFLIRGQEIQPLITCNDDAEQYNWTKYTTIDEKVKKELYDYWCSEGPLDGEPCLDSRVYK